MTVVIEYDAIEETRAFFVGRAADLMGDTAEHARDVARSEARKRTGEMANRIETEGDGLDRSVVGNDPITVYHEFGTGIHAEGQSRAEEIPWVYYDEYLGQFFTTSGVAPQPMLRPGFEAGKRYLLDEARGYFG
jgi:hypothetical protein